MSRLDADELTAADYAALDELGRPAASLCIADAPASGNGRHGLIAAKSDWCPDRLTQQANAEQLVKDFAGDAVYDVSRGRWMTYRTDEGRYAHDETGTVERAAKHVARETWKFVSAPPPGIDPKTAFRHAMDSEKSAGITAMIRLAQSEPGVSVPARSFDADGCLLNVLNGTIDLRTGAHRPHRREDRMAKVAPVRFDARADCPLFNAFMDRITDSNAEKGAYLQRIAGLALSADTSVQELFIFWGGGANGKSVLLDTITGMLGDYAAIAPESLLMSRGQSEHPTEIADLCGRRLVVASETEEGAKLRVQLVKRLTGDATIKARFMRQDFFEFPRTHKLILVTNNKPTIREGTNAVWRRVRLVPFTVTIPEQERDGRLIDKLKAEWPGILNWCIAGYLDFAANGMQTPPDVLVATAEYQGQQDVMAEYLADRCIMDPDARVSRQEIYTDYLAWAKDDHQIDRNGFYDRLRAVQGIEDAMERYHGKPTRIFKGVGLSSVASEYRIAQQRLTGVTP